MSAVNGNGKFAQSLNSIGMTKPSTFSTSTASILESCRNMRHQGPRRGRQTCYNHNISTLMASTALKTPSPMEMLNQFHHSTREVDNSNCSADEKWRKKALSSLQSLVAALEKPEDVVMRYACEATPRHLFQTFLADLSLKMGLNARLYVMASMCVSPISKSGTMEPPFLPQNLRPDVKLRSSSVVCVLVQDDD